MTTPWMNSAPRSVAPPPRRPWLRAALLCPGAALAAACVQIDTPDKPIEINLNINIRQEVVFQIDNDAKRVIDDNPAIF